MPAVILERIRSIVVERELPALARQVAAAQVKALETLARESGREPSQEAVRVAELQLGLVLGLAQLLPALELAGRDPGRRVGQRLGLRAVLRGFVRHAATVPEQGSAALELLDPTVGLQLVLSQLRPQLPASLQVESLEVLELCRLGVRDFMEPLLRGRVESSWRRFHLLTRLDTIDLAPGLDIETVDDLTLAVLLERAGRKRRGEAVPPWPEPRWQLSASPGDVPQMIRRVGSLELAGHSRAGEPAA